MISLSVHKISCLCWWEYFGSSIAIARRTKAHYLCIIFTHNFLFLGLAGFQEHSFTCLEAVYNFPRGCRCCAGAANQGCPLPPWAVQHSSAAAPTSAAAGHWPWCTRTWRAMRRLPQAHNGHWMCSPGNLLGGDRLVFLCLSLELCLLQSLHLLHGRPLPLAGTSQVSPTQAKPLGSGWRWGGLTDNGPRASHLLCIHPLHQNSN